MQQQQNPLRGGQKSSNISSSVKSKIIGGVSALAGIGLLATGIGIWHNHSSKLNVLIIGDDENIRQELIQAVLSPNYVEMTSVYARGSKFNVRLGKLIADKLHAGGNIYPMDYLEKSICQPENWNICQCGMDDPNFEQLVKESTVIIPVLDNNNTAQNLVQKLEYVPNHYNRFIITIALYGRCESLTNTTFYHGCSHVTMLGMDFVLYWDRNANTFRIQRNSTARQQTPRDFRKEQKDSNEQWNQWIRENPRPQA